MNSLRHTVYSEPRCATKHLIIFCLTAAAIGAVPAYAELVEGRDYATLLTTEDQASQGDVTVREFFSYGCPSCYAFHPHIKGWAEMLPENVTFVRTPISLRYADWTALARTFYTLDMMGDLPNVDTALFDAIHLEHRSLFELKGIAAWIQEHGIDVKRFTSIYKSDAIIQRVALAEELALHYGVDATPRIVVGERYLVLAKAARSFPEVLEITQKLIEKTVSDISQSENVAVSTRH